MTRVRSAFLFWAALTLALAAAPGLQSVSADRGSAPTVTITSPRTGYATGGSVLEVAVSFAAPTGGRADSHAPRPHAIILSVDGAETDRHDISGPFEALAHTFLLDLSSRPDGVIALGARVLGTITVGPPDTRTGQVHTKEVVIARSAPVRVRLDRDASDGVRVGPAGGDIASSDGGLRLSIPEGALGRARTITIRALDPSSLVLPDGATSTAAYELLPDGLRFDRPVTARLALPATGLQPDGTFGHEAAWLFLSSGGVFHALDDQTVVVDGASGAVGAAGTLTHFSTIFGVRADGVQAFAGPVPEVVEVGKNFDVSVVVRDSASNPDVGPVDLRRRGSLTRVAPPPGFPDEIRLGELRPGVADVFQATLTYRCDGPGPVDFILAIKIGKPRALLFGQTARSSMELRKRLFCVTPAELSGRVSSSDYEFVLDPAQSAQTVGVPFTLRLTERTFGVPSPVEANVLIADLTPGMLAGPRLLSQPPARLQKTIDGEYRVRDRFDGGGQTFQLLEYTCLRPGTAYVGFTSGGLHLLAVITCLLLPSEPPAISSSPSPAPVPVGGAFSYQPIAENAAGRTVWDFLVGSDGNPVRPDGMTIDPETGEVRFEPGPDQVGEHLVGIRVTDEFGRAAVQTFTVTVVGAPAPPPATGTVPLVLGFSFSDAQARIASAGFLLGVVTRITDPFLPLDVVIGQTPLAGTIATLRSAIDLVLNVADVGSEFSVEGPEFVVNAGTFNLPPGNRVSIAGNNGFAVVDVVTGEVPTAGTERVSFTGQGLGPFFGALVLPDPLGAGNDTVYAFGSSGFAQNMFDPVAGRFGAWLVSARPTNITDGVHFGGDHTSQGALVVFNTANEISALVPIGTGPVRGYGSIRPIVERDAFAGAPGNVVSAFAWDLAFNSDASLAATSVGQVLAVTDGLPGRLVLVDPQSRFVGVNVGDAGASPRQIRCAPSVQLCAVSNFAGDSLTIVNWDGRGSAIVLGSVAVGDGPVGIGIVADGLGAKVISTGFNDSTYTVTRLGADGSVVSNVTAPAPSGCVNPGHAIWLAGMPDKAVLSCRGSNSYTVVTP